MLRFWVLREINSRFGSKTQWQMFLLVSGRIHPGGHQHGVSIQISINVSKTFPHILHKKNCCDLNFGENLWIFTLFLFSGSGLYPLNGFEFYRIWQELRPKHFLFRSDMLLILNMVWSWSFCGTVFVCPQFPYHGNDTIFWIFAFVLCHVFYM